MPTSPTRICIVANLWMRPHVFEWACRSWRIAEANSEHEVDIVAIVSPDEDPHAEEHARIASTFGVHLDTHCNQPMSEKANYRSMVSQKLDWEYQMIMGSDDIVSPHFLGAYTEPLRQGRKLWGWSDCWFWDELATRMHYWKGYGAERQANKSIGAGRLIHRDIFDDCNWELWPKGLAMNMDAGFSAIVERHGYEIEHAKMPEGHMLVDVKSPCSITKLNQFDPKSLSRVDSPRWFMELLCQ